MTTTSMSVKRTTTGLVDILFSTIDKLNAKEIDAEHARAISHTAKTIVGVAHLELEYRKFQQTSPGNELSSISVDSEKAPDKLPGAS